MVRGGLLFHLDGARRERVGAGQPAAALSGVAGAGGRRPGSAVRAVSARRAAAGVPDARAQNRVCLQAHRLRGVCAGGHDVRRRVDAVHRADPGRHSHRGGGARQRVAGYPPPGGVRVGTRGPGSHRRLRARPLAGLVPAVPALHCVGRPCGGGVGGAGGDPAGHRTLPFACQLAAGPDAGLPQEPAVAGELLAAASLQRFCCSGNDTPGGPMKTLAAALATVALLACAKGDQANKPGADSTARNLTIAQPESGAALRDVGSKVPATTTPNAPPVRSHTKTPAQVTPKAPPPPASVVYTAASGSFLDMAVADTITSRTAKPGPEFTASGVAGRHDGARHVVVPAGATLERTIDAVKPAPNPNESGTPTLSGSTVTGPAASDPRTAHLAP